MFGCQDVLVDSIFFAVSHESRWVQTRRRGTPFGLIFAYMWAQALLILVSRHEIAEY